MAKLDYVMLVFNGSSVGGIDVFCDNSSIQDGLLDMLIIKDCNIADTSLPVSYTHLTLPTKLEV